jgi:hypothetical protein
MNIELRHLRYFLAVAETLHFGRAAEQLGMAQPPLSQQIKALEVMVGHRLFDRTTRGVRLTVVGSYLRERARNTLRQIDGDIEMARRLGRGQEGALSVGFSGSVMLPSALPQSRIAVTGTRNRRTDTCIERRGARSGLPARWRAGQRNPDRVTVERAVHGYSAAPAPARKAKAIAALGPAGRTLRVLREKDGTFGV